MIMFNFRRWANLCNFPNNCYEAYEGSGIDFDGCSIGWCIWQKSIEKKNLQRKINTTSNKIIIIYRLNIWKPTPSPLTSTQKQMQFTAFRSLWRCIEAQNIQRIYGYLAFAIFQIQIFLWRCTHVRHFCECIRQHARILNHHRIVEDFVCPAF